MFVPAYRGKLVPRSAHAVGAASTLHDGGLLGPMRRAQWNVAVLSELAEPGRMVLIPVVEREGRVVDFTWQWASPTVTLLLGCTGEDLSGRTLTQVLGASPLRNALFETCHRAFLDRSTQTAAVNGSDWQGRLDAHASAGGLTAVLTSSSAIDRFVAAQGVLRELEQLSGSTCARGAHRSETLPEPGSGSPARRRRLPLATKRAVDAER